MKITNLITVTVFSISVAANPYAGQSGRVLGTWNFEQKYLSTGSIAIEKPTCGCTTVYSTITGEGRLYSPPETSTTLDIIAQPSSETIAPTPLVTTFQTQGIYEIPAKTITLLDSLTTYVATSTSIGPGNRVAGGLTTFVDGPTTITRPYAATVTTADGVMKSNVSVSTYILPSAGTYVIGSQNTDAPESALWIYQIPTSYAAGVYTRPSTVITVTQTSYVVLCPYTSVKQIIAEPTETARLEVTPKTPDNVNDQAAHEASIIKPIINNPKTPEQVVTEPLVDNSDVPERVPEPISAEPSVTEPLVISSDTAEQVPVGPSITRPTGYNPDVPNVSGDHVSSEPTGTQTQDNSFKNPYIPVNEPIGEKQDDSSPNPESLSINPAPVPTQTVSIEPALSFPGKPSSDAPVTSEYNTLGSNDGLWAITFSPYSDNGGCKTADSVWADVANIKLAGFKTIRVYSPDCSGLENVGSAAEFHGLKVILGIFVSETGCLGAATQVKQITDWGKWHLVELVVIGNEALFNRHSSVEELTGFISSTKSTLRSAGYGGPCTTAEPLNMWQEHSSKLCEVVDVVGCNIHPFFNAGVDANNAGPFVQSQLNIVDGICPGKRGINLECGWPSTGECNGKACPGASEQATAVSGIRTYAGNISVMFTYTNDYWKSPGLFHVEQSFGMIALFLGDKA
ncbi:hypothetical protein K3495_g2093 [Podosphaera aphanis]|nr:hypothetical protein K3495_g2093 [Podosphaera aphanis]